MDDQLVHRALADPSRMRILAALADHGATLPVLEVAELVGLHPTTVRAHLVVLADAGLVASEAEPRSTPGRRRLLYRPTLEGSAAVGGTRDADGYELLARVLAAHVGATAPDAAAAGLAAGVRWASAAPPGAPEPRPSARSLPPGADPARRPGDDATSAETAVLAQLDELGFDPEVADGGGTIRLRRCPFLDAAKGDADVVCSVHLGLVRGLLTSLGAPLEATEIVPFAEPTACHLHLERSARP